MLQLDHIFILVSPNAPEANALLNLGLVEGPSNDHPGQGTSNRRFFLANTVLEFLYIKNIGEAINGAGKKLQLVERAIDIDASPFGLVTRWNADNSTPDFTSWHYQPDYFPKPMHFYVGNNSKNFTEPLCICMPPGLPKASNTDKADNPTWQLTSVELSVPGSSGSATLAAFGQCELVNIHYNQFHHITLEFNHAAEGLSKHFMPDLPLTFAW